MSVGHNGPMKTHQSNSRNWVVDFASSRQYETPASGDVVYHIDSTPVDILLIDAYIRKAKTRTLRSWLLVILNKFLRKGKEESK